MISRIDHVVIFVTDMDRAIKFYTDVLGFTIDYPSPEYTSVNTGGETSIGLHIADKVVGTGMATTQVSFLVDDINLAYENLKEKGVKIEREVVEIAPKRFLFNFVDPDNNSLSCFEIRNN